MYNGVELKEISPAEGDDSMRIDLYELYVKMEYKFPYHRWVNKWISDYWVRCKLVRKKTGRAGPPVIHYVARVDDCRDMLNGIVRRRNKEIKIGDTIYNGEIGNESTESAGHAGLFRSTRREKRGLRLVRE